MNPPDDTPRTRQPRQGLKRWLACVILFAGRSNAPLVDFLDYARPGRLEKGTAPPHGGVCTPGQGTIPIVQPNPNLPSTPAVIVPGPAPVQGPYVQPTGPPPVPPPPPPKL